MPNFSLPVQTQKEKIYLKFARKQLFMLDERELNSSYNYSWAPKKKKIMI